MYDSRINLPEGGESDRTKKLGKKSCHGLSACRKIFGWHQRVSFNSKDSNNVISAHTCSRLHSPNGFHSAEGLLRLDDVKAG